MDVVSLCVMCCSVNVSVCFVCCVFVNCLVKQFAMCLGVVAILLLNVMEDPSSWPLGHPHSDRHVSNLRHPDSLNL